MALIDGVYLQGKDRVPLDAFIKEMTIAALDPPDNWHHTAALDSLAEAHPTARLAPPFRRVEITLASSIDAPLYSEIVIPIGGGEFVGFITSFHHHHYRYQSTAKVEIHEAACYLGGGGQWDDLFVEQQQASEA